MPYPSLEGFTITPLIRRVLEVPFNTLLDNTGGRTGTWYVPSSGQSFLENTAEGAHRFFVSEQGVDQMDWVDFTTHQAAVLSSGIYLVEFRALISDLATSHRPWVAFTDGKETSPTLYYERNMATTAAANNTGFEVSFVLDLDDGGQLAVFGGSSGGSGTRYRFGRLTITKIGNK